VFAGKINQPATDNYLSSSQQLSATNSEFADVTAPNVATAEGKTHSSYKGTHIYFVEGYGAKTALNINVLSIY